MAYEIKQISEVKYQVTWVPPVILALIGITPKTNVYVDTDQYYVYQGDTVWYNQTKDREEWVPQLDKWIRTQKYREM